MKKKAKVRNTTTLNDEWETNRKVLFIFDSTLYRCRMTLFVFDFCCTDIISIDSEAISKSDDNTKHQKLLKKKKKFKPLKDLTFISFFVDLMCLLSSEYIYRSFDVHLFHFPHAQIFHWADGEQSRSSQSSCYFKREIRLQRTDDLSFGTHSNGKFGKMKDFFGVHYLFCVRWARARARVLNDDTLRAYVSTMQWCMKWISTLPANAIACAL